MFTVVKKLWPRQRGSVKNFISNPCRLVMFTPTSSSPQSGMLIPQLINVTIVILLHCFKAWIPICAVNHFNRFPRSIGEIISAHSVRELHLSLTQGLWRTHKWGFPARYAGPGAEVSATFPSHLTRYSIIKKSNSYHQTNDLFKVNKWMNRGLD